MRESVCASRIRSIQACSRVHHNVNPNVEGRTRSRAKSSPTIQVKEDRCRLPLRGPSRHSYLSASSNIPLKSLVSKLAGGSAPERVVDLVHDIGGADHAVVEVAAVETLESLLTARDRVELDVDVALGVGIDSNVYDLSVLLVALALDFCLEVFDPVAAEVLLFPVDMLAVTSTWNVVSILVGVKGVLDLDTLRRHDLVDNRNTGLGDDGLSALGRLLGWVATGQSVHQLAPIVSLEVDAGNVGVVQGRCAADATVVLAVGAVEDTTCASSVCATSTSTAESRALV